MGTTNTPRRDASPAEQMHRDATDARAILTRMLGWNLPLSQRSELADALDTVNDIDGAALKAMRLHALEDEIRAMRAAPDYEPTAEYCELTRRAAVLRAEVRRAPLEASA